MFCVYTCRCKNEEKVKVVRVVAKEIAKLSARLVDCASQMAVTFQEDEDGEQPPLEVREEAELLRREWSSQVSSKRCILECTSNDWLLLMLWFIASI